MLYPQLDDLIKLKSCKFSSRLISQRSTNSTIPGNHHSPFRGQGLEFDAVREYVPGDDIRSIDWRVTARTGAPHLKLFKEERERQLLIAVDMNSGMRFGTRNTFKSVQAAHVAAFLGWQGIAEHDSVGACLYGDVPEGMQLLAPKRTRSAFGALLKMLTEPYSERYQVNLNDVLQHVSKAARTGALVYFISDFLAIDSHFEPHPLLSRLSQKCDVVFIAINDPADQSIHSLGAIGCWGESSEKMYVNTESLAGRRAYQALWESNRRRLNEIAAQFKIPLLELTTAMNVRRDLASGLKSIGRRKR